MENQLICSGCGRKVTNTGGTVVFTCPNCGNAQLARCKQCRITAKKYKCPSCGFEGPN